MMRYAKALCALVAVLAQPATAQTAADFVGTWELVSIERVSESGEWSPVLYAGADPVGVIMYDGIGNMAVQISTAPRVTEIPGASPEWVNGYIAYYARYEVDVAAGTVTHHRRNHLNPEISGLSVVRYFHFDGDILTLTVAPDRTVRLNWARAR
jgi:hypothetical protein